MSPRHPLALAGAAGAGLAAAAWTARLKADRRAVRDDPAADVLAAPLEGRPLALAAGDDTPLHAEAFGPEDAPTVVLVHGWSCALRFWTCQIQALAVDHRVIAYDLRGHGASGRPEDGDYSIDAHAADLAAVLRAVVPAGERAVVAGHSLGAMTLVALAGELPEAVTERVAAAALVNTGMGDLISESFVLRTPGALDGARQVVGRVMLSAAAPLPKGTTPISHRAVRYIALSPQASPAQVAFCERIVLECPRDVRAACGGTLTELDLHDAVRSLELPTVVIAGDADRLTPPSHARRMADTLPQLEELCMLDGSGHMSPVSDADAVTARLRRLARDHAPTGARDAA